LCERREDYFWVRRRSWVGEVWGVVGLESGVCGWFLWWRAWLLIGFFLLRLVVSQAHAVEEFERREREAWHCWEVWSFVSIRWTESLSFRGMYIPCNVM
jgi:hypothetical protein